MSGSETRASGRRQKVAVACTACQARKSRCSGVPPCDACVSMGAECVVDETLDGRRKVAFNRKVDEFVHNTWILEGLLLSLRTLQPEPRLNILNLVNNGAPLPILAASISEALLQTPEVAVQAPMNPFLVDAKVRRSAQASGRKRSHEDDSWVISSNGCIDPIALSQKLQDFARAANVSNSACDSRPVSQAGSPPCQQAVDAQMLSFDSTTPYSSKPDYQFHSGHTYDLQVSEGLHTQGDANISSQLDEPCTETFYSGTPPVTQNYSIVGGAGRPQVNREQLRPPRRASRDRNVHSREGHRKRLMSTVNGSGCASSRPSRPGVQHTRSGRQGDPTPLIKNMLPPNSYNNFAGTTSHNAFKSQHVSRNPTSANAERSRPPIGAQISHYMERARAMLSAGALLSHVLGPERPGLDLLFERRRPNDAHSVNNFVSEMTAGIDGMETATRFAISHMFTYLLRWLLLPTDENFSKVPAMYRPTVMQMNTPHSASVEFCPIPQLRNSLCRRNQDFLACFATNINCSWPYSPDACIEMDPQTGDKRLTDAFCRHIADPENWTLNSDMLNMFPECANPRINVV